MLNKNENGNFKKLYTFAHNHENEIFDIYIDKKVPIKAKFDTDYESDNGLELDDKNYEEYYEMLFKPIDKLYDGYIIINYHTLPYKITCNNIIIYEEDNI